MTFLTDILEGAGEFTDECTDICNDEGTVEGIVYDFLYGIDYAAITAPAIRQCIVQTMNAVLKHGCTTKRHPKKSTCCL